MAKRKEGDGLPKLSKALWGYLIVIIVMIIAAIIFKTELKAVYTNPELTKNFIASFGAFGPLLLIFLQAAQVIIFVIPGPVFTIAGGYAFGIVAGTIYSLIGTLLGSILVFYLGKTYGRPFVEKMVNKRDLKKVDRYFEKKGKPALLISRTIPIMFPNDLVSFGASLTKLSYKDYILISFIGFIPNIFILNLFGEQISHGTTPTVLIIMSIVGVSVLAYIFRDFLSHFFIKKNKK